MRTREIPICPASTSRARCKDAASRRCDLANAPQAAAVDPDRRRAIARRRNDKIAWSKVTPRTPVFELRGVLRSTMTAPARCSIRRLRLAVLEISNRGFGGTHRQSTYTRARPRKQILDTRRLILQNRESSRVRKRFEYCVPRSTRRVRLER